MTAPHSLAFVVDDEPAMLDIVTFALETQGFTTESFRSAETAWTALERSRPDLVVLDIMLPGISGISLCQRIKSRWDLPVILVTAKGEVSDRIAGLEAEADDYVAKPFHPRELALRAQRLVRRPESSRAVVTSGVRLELDPASHDVIVAAERVSLTNTEYKLLAALMAHPNSPLDFSQLLLMCWGEYDRHGDREMIKAAVYRMRHKLEAAVTGSAAAIESVRGTGYLLRADRT
ncbi:MULTISPECIES: response regulator transcription factor [unclassified Pseudoclavibacter]|uniref:response regulator transcription factor n=1 Tax=unclassified Pseudoclavibacter TaxID=2615177 RepID=UPI000CE774DA|nr:MULTISPECIES: response regulator transcription factor [unclassified Pseudoclavibacter]MBF4550061.1 response regulator transcription factor [Pseudoclavibacter sp. VKM Ac-2888]PPF38487.1 DNA-binding response regulator [Pseudoclavibacter sp. AY1H1]PPF74868.1 DNA-binding response regulator [Pseudoclavibacter sp. Z016]PPG03347.1 DNA-binding response regulator [Pseudoclavibacter sp. RFBI5]